MDDWDKLTGSALSAALSDFLSHLVARQRDQQLLETVTSRAEHATQEGDQLEVNFAGGYVLSIHPQEDEDTDLTAEWPVAARRAARLTLEFSRAGREGLNLSPDILDLDDYDLDSPFDGCPRRLPVALRDFSDWWAFVPQPDGPAALTLVDHGGNFDPPTDMSLGGLYLSRVAEVLGDGLLQDKTPQPDSRISDVVTRCMVSDLFADEPSKHIEAVANHEDCYCLVGSNGIVLVDIKNPWRVIGRIDFGRLRLRGHINTVCRGDELFVGHCDGNLRIDVSTPTSPHLLGRHDVLGDRRSFATTVASFEYVHYNLPNPAGRADSWYVGSSGADLSKFADEDNTVVSAVLVDDRFFVASQGSLTRFDVSNPAAPILERRAALNAYRPRLVARPDSGQLIVVDDEPAHALRVVSMDSLRSRSSSWNVFKLSGRQQVSAWQLHNDRIDLLILDKEELLLVTVSLPANTSPNIQKTRVVGLPEGRRPWDPCIVRVQPGGLGVLFRDGEWIQWHLED